MSLPRYLVSVADGEVLTITTEAEGAAGALTCDAGNSFLLVERVS